MLMAFINNDCILERERKIESPRKRENLFRLFQLSFSLYFIS